MVSWSEERKVVQWSVCGPVLLNALASDAVKRENSEITRFVDITESQKN